MCAFEKIAELFTTVWPVIFAFDLGRYAVAALGVFVLVYVALRPWLRGRKTQARLASRADIRREMLFSALTAVIFSLNGLGIYAGVEAGIMKVYFDMADYGWGCFAISLVLLILVHDAYFYWTHRMMHQPRLFRLFHLTHHRSRTPTPFAAYAFAPAEAVVQAIFLPLFLLVVPTHDVAIFIFMTHMIIRNAFGHAGYELFPRGAPSSRWLGWLTTTTHHDMHHENLRGNFGLYFTWWDRLVGTEHPDYRARFDQVTAPRPTEPANTRPAGNQN